MRFTVFGIILVSILLHVDAEMSKKSRCHFDKRCCNSIKNEDMLFYYKADCSYLNLTTALKVPNDIKVVDFSHNRIQTIQNGHFKNNSALQVLILSNNQLQYLTNDSFVGLNSVAHLRLDNNNLTQISSFSITNLTMLQYLDLKKNNLVKTDIIFPISLRTLKMDLLAASHTFKPKGLDKLENLDVSGISGNCNITTVTSETFHFAPSLQNLDISGCKINFIYRGAFRFMSILTVLNISINPCLKFDGLKNVTSDLPYTSIRILNLNKIHKTFDLNTILKTSQVEGLNSTNLTEIHLESNRIQLLEKDVLKVIPNTLKTVYAGDNEFSYGCYIHQVPILKVEFAKLSFMFRSKIPFPNEEECYKQDQIAYVSKTESTKGDVDKCGIDRKPIPILPVPPRLKTVLFRESTLRYEIPKFNICNNSLEHLDLSSNVFYSWIGPILQLMNLTYLDLSNNFCSNVSKIFFHSFPNIKNLSIQNNLLGFVLPDDSKGDILQHVPNLELINLSENRIPSLPSSFFKAQSALRKVILAGNLLENITLKLEHMTHLSLLNLSNNKITSLGKQTRDEINSIMSKRKNFITIDLSNNPLMCTCETMDFIQWMTLHFLRFHQLKKYICELSNENKIPLDKPRRVYEKLKKECRHYTVLIVIVVAVFSLFIFILSWGLIYRHRWKLRYMYYLAKSKYSRANRTVLETDGRTYIYDAFISYEDKDRFFVHDILLRKLENEAGLKLCLHKRDFIPGNDISENITFSLHNSRKVVVIMSYNYLESYWCMFEYNMARMESIYSRNKENILFLVFLAQISPKDLPLMVLELVQSQSYIEYPNDEYGDTIFWENIKRALS